MDVREPSPRGPAARGAKTVVGPPWAEGLRGPHIKNKGGALRPPLFSVQKPFILQSTIPCHHTTPYHTPYHTIPYTMPYHTQPANHQSNIIQRPVIINNPQSAESWNRRTHKVIGVQLLCGPPSNCPTGSKHLPHDSSSNAKTRSHLLS